MSDSSQKLQEAYKALPVERKEIIANYFTRVILNAATENEGAIAVDIQTHFQNNGLKVYSEIPRAEFKDISNVSEEEANSVLELFKCAMRNVDKVDTWRIHNAVNGLLEKLKSEYSIQFAGPGWRVIHTKTEIEKQRNQTQPPIEPEPIKTATVDGLQQIVMPFAVEEVKQKRDPNAELYGYQATNKTDRQRFKRKLERTRQWFNELPPEEAKAIKKMVSELTTPPR